MPRSSSLSGSSCATNDSSPADTALSPVAPSGGSGLNTESVRRGPDSGTKSSFPLIRRRQTARQASTRSSPAPDQRAKNKSYWNMRFHRRRSGLDQIDLRLVAKPGHRFANTFLDRTGWLPTQFLPRPCIAEKLHMPLPTGYQISLQADAGARAAGIQEIDRFAAATDQANQRGWAAPSGARAIRFRGPGDRGTP